jgi:hypothetical protein
MLWRHRACHAVPRAFTTGSREGLNARQQARARFSGYDSFGAPCFNNQINGQQSGYLGAFEGATPRQPAEQVDVAPRTVSPPAGRLPPPAQTSPPAAATKDQRVPDGAPR